MKKSVFLCDDVVVVVTVVVWPTTPIPLCHICIICWKSDFVVVAVSK